MVILGLAPPGLGPGEELLRYEVRDEPGETVIIWLSGSFTQEDWTARLRGFLEEHYINDGVRIIMLDLGEVEEIDLEGVATLMILLRESDDRGKRLMTQNARGRVRVKLEMSGVLTRLEGH